jgi:Domain of unknown function (DUF5667)
MHRPQPNRLHDELDALLDGRPVELTEELAPLAEAADALRAELAAHQLDPAVADRHLELVLGGPANVVRMPARPQPNGWDVRRRVAAVVLAAALVLVPATMASAAALPGQAMYPFKLAIEQLRLASVGWSPSREAGERTRVAHERLSEVQKLYELEMYNQLPTAIEALNRAVFAAKVAVAEAERKGELAPAVEDKLTQVVAVGAQVLDQVLDTATNGAAVGLTGDTAKEIQAAVEAAAPVVNPSSSPPSTDPNGGGTATSTTPAAATQTTQGSAVTAPTLTPTTTPATNPSETSTSQAPTTTVPTTTTPSTTEATTTTEGTAAPGSSASLGVGAGGGGGQGGSSDNTLPEQAQGAPPTTSP